MVNQKGSRQKQARILRVFRKIHRVTGACLFIFFFIVAITGLLLGWKKNSKGYLLATSQKGVSTSFNDWLTVDSLEKKAVYYLDSLQTGLTKTIDRIDFRPEKGMVKFLFTDHFTALQLDASSGRLLGVEIRRADFIEKVHDGSIVDHYFHLSSGSFKLIYTTIIGLALLVFAITGFWLWYGPKRMRAHV